MRKINRFYYFSLIIFLMLISVFCLDIKNVQAMQKENVLLDKNLVEYTGDIEHLFTHCLLAYPNLALDRNNKLSVHYDRDCLTPNEFKNILQSLYDRNYVLVNIYDIFEVINGVPAKKTLYLPKGKKPLIFSFDDVVYDSKKKDSGMVDKIIVDSKNNVATYTFKADIKVSYDNEFVTILENFVKENPDFSFNGAKGLICLTGFDGILGYKINDNNANKLEEIKQAKIVVKRLKELGWSFACHSYGHYHMKNLTEKAFKKDIENWQKYIEPIIGKTNIYVYPYGEWEITKNNGELSNKHKMLLEAGFKLFLGVGAKTFFNYMPLGTTQRHTLFMDRKPIDGYTLRNFQNYYKHLFNCKEVYDHDNRVISFYSKSH